MVHRMQMGARKQEQTRKQQPGQHRDSASRWHRAAHASARPQAHYTQTAGARAAGGSVPSRGRRGTGAHSAPWAATEPGRAQARPCSPWPGGIASRLLRIPAVRYLSRLQRFRMAPVPPWSAPSASLSICCERTRHLCHALFRVRRGRTPSSANAARMQRGGATGKCFVPHLLPRKTVWMSDSKVIALVCAPVLCGFLLAPQAHKVGNGKLPLESPAPVGCVGTFVAQVD